MNPRITALVTNVKDFKRGSDLTSAVSAGAGTLPVASLEDFKQGGGRVQIGTEIHTYTIDDPAVAELNLTGTLVSAYPDQEPVLSYPLRVERIAFLLENDNDEEQEAVVPPEFWDRLPLGTRTTDDTQLVTARREGVDLVVRRIVAEEPFVDGRSTRTRVYASDGIEIDAASDASGIDNNKLRWLDEHGDPLTVEWTATDVGPSFRHKVLLEDPNDSDNRAALAFLLIPGSDLAQVDLTVNTNVVNLMTLLGAGVKSSQFVLRANESVGEGMTWGATAVAMGGASSATLNNVAHGVGDTPGVIVATCDKSVGAGSAKCFATVGSLTSTDFSISVRTHDDTTIAGSVTVRWIALA